MKKLLCVMALLLAAMAVSCGKDDDKSFAKADYNKDGKVVFEELIVAYPDLTTEEYESFDADKTGSLTEEEYATFLQARTSGNKPVAQAEPDSKEPASAATAADLPEPPSAQTKEAQAAPDQGAATAAPGAMGGDQALQAQAPGQTMDTVEVLETTEALTMPEGGKVVEELVSVAEQSAPEPAAEQTYELKRGDNLSKVASRFGVSLKALMQANNIDNPDRVEAGAKLVIPQGGKPTGETDKAPGDAKDGKTLSGPMADKAAMFVDGFLAKSAQDDVEGLVDMYADQVKFYKKGEVAKDFIRKDKMDYFTRWPVREYSKIGQVQVYETEQPRVKKVVFVSEYRVKNNQKALSGQAEFSLLIRFDGDVGAIVAEDGKVLKR